MRTFGTAHLAGIQIGITWSTLDSKATIDPTSIKATRQWEEKVRLLNPATGELIGRTTTEDRRLITIQGIPVAASGGADNTRANAAKLMIDEPDQYQVVTISGRRNTNENGSYNYIGGWDVAETPDGAILVTMNLERRLASESAPATLATEILS